MIFTPWFPLAAGEMARPGGPLDKLSRQHGATVSQLTLAWLLQRFPVVLPIPGTASISHLEENVGAAALQLAASEGAEVEQATKGR